MPLERCHGVGERMGPDGVLRELDVASIPTPDAEAVAVCLLFSFRHPEHERAVVEELRRRLPHARVVASHELAPEFREYERASTTVVDAYLAPLIDAALGRLAEATAAAGLPEPLVMASSGGLLPLAEAAAHPARIVLSGPAAGVVGAARVAAASGFPAAISFDMGGTSTDVALIAGGEAGRSAERDRRRPAAAAADRRRAHGRRRRRLDRAPRRRVPRCTSARGARARDPARPATGTAAPSRP